MIRNSFIILIAFLSTCVSSKMTGQESKAMYIIHFVDDFEDNTVTLKFNNDTVIDQSLFRKSDIPQLKQLLPMNIQVFDEKLIVYSKGKKERELILKEPIIESNVNLHLMVDDKSKIHLLSPKDGKYIIISYSEGELGINQSKMIN